MIDIRWPYAVFLVWLLVPTRTPAQEPYFQDAGHLASQARAVAWGDYNNDGYVDLVTHSQGAGLLLRGGPDGRLVSDRRLEIDGFPGGGATWADVDRDGDLDLFLTNWATLEANHLYRNEEGTFRDVTAAAGLDFSLSTDNAIWLDYDRDGHLDLFAGDTRCPPTSSVERAFPTGSYGTWAMGHFRM